MTRRRTAASAAIGTALVALLLTGCTAFGGDDPLPKPTRQAAERNDEPLPDPTLTTEQIGGDADEVEQVLPTGTVAAETDVTSPSGDTSIHVRIVANDQGTFDAQLSGYRTTNPQPMSLQFRHRTASPLDGDDSSVRDTVEWDAGAGPPTSFTMGQSGPLPDYLRSVVLVPASVEDEDPSKRPWVGSVLAVGALDWKIPNPYPDMRITVGKDRPGAYGIVTDADGRPADYLVAHGDELTTVAQRFGITPAEVQWLNPYMETRADDWLLEGSTLNLDPARR
ncbi:LysM peptidoglycan-binding domain-containing protein [Curtobacterium sp. VKM Ac-1393]|uniref:LysM peptidoglycan-binding domain-containing protein n=1 Tax=Curtobacterium sp. VKM Ac-1393 TaxID=2783814 RepID=UPI00188D136B|nr:LysM peptidoglycan-binding domain-containing protein [Curtobacterium sp. VKM Ac-1393]MBF4607748.1 LysM peptidoglycan-binding domain-containing protein [Curtobacterium sp. VKM Ac-1393]